MTLTAKEDIEDRRLWVGISIRKPQAWVRKSIGKARVIASRCAGGSL